MKRIVRLAALSTLAFGTAGQHLVAQDNDAPARDVFSIQDRPGFVAAVEAIAEGHEKEGLLALEKIAHDFAGDPDLYLLHYNAACGQARLGEKAKALAELATAIERGYGLRQSQLLNLLQDPDLDPLRKEARLDELLQEAKKRYDDNLASLAAQFAPFTWLPPPASDPELAKKKLPLLIVLHPFASEREAFARANFLPFCEANRFALLAPSGQQLIAPGRIAWTSASGDFLENFRADARRVWEAFDTLKREQAIDTERVYVVGVGQGAALGFAVALRNPQWVRGAVLFDGGYAPATLHDWTERAAQWGRRVALEHRRDDPLYPFAPLAAYSEVLKQQKLAVELFPVDAAPTRGPAEFSATLSSRLPWIDEVPFQKPAPERR